MSRRLIVMRHAKSSWDDPQLPDRDRPLNARGELAAVLMGAWLDQTGLVPDHALLSPVRRVLETWARLLRGAGLSAETGPGVTEIPQLYMAGPEASLEALRAAPDSAGALLMLGHEPGGSAFLRRLHDGHPAAGAARVFEKFPTAAAVLVEMPDAPWSQAAFGQGRLVRFVAPKDLV
ncbi:MAG: SixA phosphatase family protein [Pseudomonadota bacterium]